MTINFNASGPLKGHDSSTTSRSSALSQFASESGASLSSYDGFTLLEQELQGDDSIIEDTIAALREASYHHVHQENSILHTKGHSDQSVKSDDGRVRIQRRSSLDSSLNNASKMFPGSLLSPGLQQVARSSGTPSRRRHQRPRRASLDHIRRGNRIDSPKAPQNSLRLDGPTPHAIPENGLLFEAKEVSAPPPRVRRYGSHDSMLGPGGNKASGSPRPRVSRHGSFDSMLGLGGNLDGGNVGVAPKIPTRLEVEVQRGWKRSEL